VKLPVRGPPHNARSIQGRSRCVGRWQVIQVDFVPDARRILGPIARGGGLAARAALLLIRLGAERVTCGNY